MYDVPAVPPVLQQMWISLTSGIFKQPLKPSPTHPTVPFVSVWFGLEPEPQAIVVLEGKKLANVALVVVEE